MPRHNELTVADRDLLERLCEGQHSKQIAFDRGVADHAVRMQICRVMELLGAKNRLHAVALYLAPEKYRKP